MSAKLCIVRRIKLVFTRVFTCGALLVLPSCSVPGLRSPEAGPQLPTSFNVSSTTNAKNPATEANSTNNIATQSVQQFFNDPLLSELVAQAVVGNQELRILFEDIQIANNEILARQGAYLPFVTFGSGAGFEKSSRYTREGAVEEGLTVAPNRAFPNPLPNLLVAANFSWQIDIWRQLRNSRDAAALRFLGTADGRNYITTRLVAEIAEQYYELMALDKRLETLNRTIELQEQSLKLAEAKKAAARDTELPVQRFDAEVRKNQSEKYVVQQEIIERENRINFLLGRAPQPIARQSERFLDLDPATPAVGQPTQLLQNRPDIRQAERELAASGLDVEVARARFYPTLVFSSGIGYSAFTPRYLFTTPEALVANFVLNLAGPLINRNAIIADYQTANARQIQAVYNYQRVMLNAYLEVVNRVTKAENYRRSAFLKKQQIEALDAAVETASKLYQNARPGIDYSDVLFSQRDMLEARLTLIEIKKQQLTAIVATYQALGGGTIMSQPSASPPIGEVIGPVPTPASMPPATAPGPALMPAPPQVPATVPAQLPLAVPKPEQPNLPKP